ALGSADALNPTYASALPQHRQRRPKAAAVAIGEHDIAPVAARNGACERKPESEPSGLAAARLFEPDEGIEHALHLLLRKPRPVVVNEDHDLCSVALDRDARALTVAHRVLDEIARRATQLVRPADRMHGRALEEGDVVAEIRKVGAHALDQRRDVDFPC